MALAVHQVATKTQGVAPPSSYSSTTATFASPVGAGHGLTIAFGIDMFIGVADVDTPTGWTRRAELTVDIRKFVVFTKVAGASEPLSVTITHSARRRQTMAMIEHDGAFGSIVTDTDTTATTHAVPSLTPTASAETLLLALMLVGNAQGLSSGPASYTAQVEIVADDGASERLLAWSRYVASASGAYTGTATFAGSCYGAQVQLAFYVSTPTAEFDAEPSGGLAPLEVDFTDLSTGNPTSWAWDFGDGDTSTDQDPSHTYDQPGAYTVSLTATNAAGSDTETKIAFVSVTADVGYEPPPPAGAIIEIKASAPGSAKWGIAKWGEAVWSAAAWQSITPESVSAIIRWGSTEPELGILSQPSAGSWSVRIHDPFRLLDPANPDSPYATDLEPGLPVRVNHRGLTIRQGIAESIGHEFVDGRHVGFMRVTDNQSRLANAAVPFDTELSDTLYARARDAISAAGVNVTVLPDPPTGDPALVEWAPGNEWSAWRWIADAARQCLAIPYIDRLGRLGFRTWSTPLHRARELASPQLVALHSISTYQGLYSRVEASDALGDIERALTPPPRYGKRTFTRTELVLDAEAWAQSVLDDRALPRIRWVPADVFPLTADDVEYFATIEPVELVGIRVDEEDPPVLADAIIVGGQIAITAKRADEASWRFAFEATQTPFLPLVVDGSDPSEFLFTEAGDEYLYPD